MDVPEGLMGALVSEGEKYFFTVDCPIGIPEHIHICIKRGKKMLFFSTCSSQTDTAFRLAKLKGWDMNTFPVFPKNGVNRFTKEYTYVDCNHVIEISEHSFERLLKDGKAHLLKGKIDELGLSVIAKGVKLSTEVERRIKDLF